MDVEAGLGRCLRTTAMSMMCDEEKSNDNDNDSPIREVYGILAVWVSAAAINSNYMKRLYGQQR